MKANTSFAAISGAVPFGPPALRRWPAAAGVAALLEFAAIAPEQVPLREHGAADAGQDTVASSSSEPSGGLIYEREFFVYTARQRDPFLPPRRSGTTGTFTDGIRLLGIIHHDRTDLSVVLLGNVRTTVDEADSRIADGRRRKAVRLRLGQSLGDMRLARIRPDHIVLEVDMPTGVVRRMLQISQANERTPS